MTQTFQSRLLLIVAAALTAVAPTQAATVYALTASSRLIRFDSSAPGILTNDVPVSGLVSGDRLAGIDFRPANGLLYGVSSGSRIYTINPQTGAAAQVGTSAFTPAASGTVFGVDFNPVPDRIRFVSNTGQNLRLQPDTGAVAATDTSIAYTAGDVNAATPPSIAEVAYTNSFAGATVTTLYAIDSATSSLVRVGSPDGTPVSPNSGMLATVGKLGPGIVSTAVGFDISRFGTAYAAFQAMSANSSSLYTVDLNTGAATSIGPIGSNLIVTGLAIQENTGPTGACSLTGTPAINGIANAASFTGPIAPNSLATAFFSGITGTTAAMASAADLFAGRFPLELGCIAIEIGGVRAPVTYTGLSQINFQIPVSAVSGVTTTRLILNPGRANEVRGTVLNGPTIQASAPGLFTLNGTSVAAQAADFTLIGNPATFPGARAARPGEVILLYATGLGLTEPVYQSGEIPAATAAIRGSLTVNFGGIAVAPADILYAGVTQGSISGLYQINLRVPAAVANGTVPVQIAVDGVTSQSDVTIPVQR